MIRRIQSGPIFILGLIGILYSGGKSHAEEMVSLDFQDVLSVEEVNGFLEAKKNKNKEESVFYFGFDLRASPQEDARQYLPFIDYLSRVTGYKFELRFTPKNSSIVDDLGKGKVHFAAIGAVSFIKASETYGAISLVRGVNIHGETRYRSMIVVHPDSNVQSLDDLKGKHFAFGSTSSTQGHLIPRIVLSNSGIKLNDFASYSYTGSHEACAKAVIDGDFDACGMQDTMAQSLEEKGLVRVLHVSDYFPSSGIAATQGIQDDSCEKIKNALLDFDPNGKDKKGLYNWQRTEMPNGFQSTEEADYRTLREWLLRFDMLDSNIHPVKVSAAK